MKSIIVYWSGTGNTQKMAEAVQEACKSKGDADLFEVNEAPDSLDDYDYYFFGCPAMGDEELEDMEFEPWYEKIETQISGKKIFLFGSYSWADGEWMETWSERAESKGASVETAIQFDEPDDADLDELKDKVTQFLS